MENLIREAAKLIKNSKQTGAFTGSGISVESGIPPFRGENGIWAKYDPQTLELHYFFNYPEESWKVIKKIFYDYFGAAKFNRAHEVLAILEQKGILKGVTTQNIDNLHQEAGSKTVYEFHGNSKKLICTGCRKHFEVDDSVFKKLPPYCLNCNGLLKPDFIFFGENIPMDAYQNSIKLSESSDVFLVIGTTGEVMPANQMPVNAKRAGAKIIEVNTEPSRFTSNITDIFLRGRASEVMDKLLSEIEELN
jgi:NAD-dependent deacetylase